MSAARAEEPAENPEIEAALGAERDALIRKLARGEDTSSCVRAFTRLLERRAAMLKTAAQAALNAQRAEQDKQRAEQAAEAAKKRAEADQQRREAAAEAARKQRAAERQAYLDSLDYNVGKYCRLVVDPHERHYKGSVSADWGKVVRKAQVRIPPANPLADEQVLTMYEIAGVREHHFLRGDRMTGLRAELGDLIFLGDPYGNADRHLPPPWNEVPLANPGYTGRIAAPPAIAKKGKWNPIHITLGDIAGAIREVSWSFPKDRYVLVNLQVGAALAAASPAPDRFLIPAFDEATSFVLEVPSGLPRRELIKPEAFVWVILGQARFDRALKKLVLVAEDVEPRYLFEAP